jgi:hypothetical protein
MVEDMKSSLDPPLMFKGGSRELCMSSTTCASRKYQGNIKEAFDVLNHLCIKGTSRQHQGNIKGGFDVLNYLYIKGTLRELFMCSTTYSSREHQGRISMSSTTCVLREHQGRI